MLNVLIACEYSGTVRDAFTRKGHWAVSCDLLPTETPGMHHVGDVTDLITSDRWDLIIAHPPCTYIANSGSRWFSSQPDRYGKMVDATDFFKKFLDVSCPFAIENPIPSGIAVDRIGRKYDQLVHPYHFNEPYTKATCLWLSPGLPKLKTTHKATGQEQVYTDTCRSSNNKRAKVRSKTFQGIADAMVTAWG